MELSVTYGFQKMIIGTTKWPDRKKPTLYIASADGNSVEILAYFRDDDAREQFDKFLELTAKIKDVL
jgi:hypothetical protein